MKISYKKPVHQNLIKPKDTADITRGVDSDTRFDSIKNNRKPRIYTAAQVSMIYNDLMGRSEIELIAVSKSKAHPVINRIIAQALLQDLRCNSIGHLMHVESRAIGPMANKLDFNDVSRTLRPVLFNVQKVTVVKNNEDTLKRLEESSIGLNASDNPRTE